MTRTKLLTAVALVGAIAMAASPSQARDGRNAAAAIGFGAGALVGAAAASAANNSYYGPGYYEPGYAYDRGYAYEPGYVEEPAYAYEPAPVVTYSAGPGWNHDGQCWISTDQGRGYGYYGACAQHNEDQFNARIGDFRTNRSRIK
ncbi:MAG TPA: hypothetical protein VHL34_20750 [Rhizomicrobium sp.]|jgi:hypothetical protein|nr:hypothetical protein [Pseudolabrys sp.]HEX2593942.1 hypothetical protein [Rhizomicrobium sp.]